MITKLITVEHLKMRRTYIWFMLLIGTIIGCGLGLFLYLANLNAFVNTNNQFLALWGEFNIFSSQIFIPLFLAIIVGINIQTEKSNRMLNSLRTMSIKPSFIFVSKLIYIAVLQLTIQVISASIYLIVGYGLGLKGNVDILTLIQWEFLGWLGSIGIIAIQLGIALIVKSLTVNLLINFGFVIGGFIVALFSSSITDYYPFSQIMIGIYAHDISHFTFATDIRFGFIIGIGILIGWYIFIRTFNKNK